jgi:hypothetical protein
MAKEPKARPANQFDDPVELKNQQGETITGSDEVAGPSPTQEGRNRADKPKAKGAGRDADHDREVALDAAVHWGTTMGKDTGNPQAPDAIVDAAKKFYAFLQASDGRG